jgi:hypothetical protein
MRRFLMFFGGMVLLTCAATAQQTANVPSPGSGSDVSVLEQKIRDLEDRLVMLEGQVRQLKAQGAGAASQSAATPAAPPAAPSTQAQVATPQDSVRSTAYAADNVRLGGAGGAAAKALNPDISVIGDFIAGAGHNPLNPTPSFQMHESEVGLQAIVDPYARADFFISFGETGVNVEEGFITFTALPVGFVAKAGKMRAAFGKVNTLHNHVLPWVDRPLVSQNLVGGEDGINDAGFSVEHIIPAPGKWFLDFTGQTFRGDSADVYTSSNKNDLSVVGHLRGYRDLTDNSNLDLGLSYSRGHNLFGSDFIWRQQNQPSLVACQTITCPVNTAAGFQRAFGFYASGDFQFARRWFVGGRVDRSDRAFNSHLDDKGGSLVLTYWPSEFAQIRGQYRFTRYADRFDAHEAFIQLQFALGAHGAHPF